MTAHTSRNIARCIAIKNKLASAFACRRRELAGLRWGIRRIKCRKMVGDFFEIGVGQIGHHMRHRRILATAIAEMPELVIEIAGRLTSNTRKKSFAGRPAFFAMTRGAGDGTFGDVGPDNLGVRDGG